MIPKRRRKGLLVRELPDETVVYDTERGRAYCLNDTAASVWKACNGQTPVSAVGELLEKKLGIDDGTDVAALAVTQLCRAHLLEDAFVKAWKAPGLSRRQLMRHLKGAALALPVVLMILAPTAASAASPISVAACQKQKKCSKGACVIKGQKCVATGDPVTPCDCQ